MNVRPWRKEHLVFGAPQIGPEERAEVLACLDSGWLGTGPRVAELEARMRVYLGAPAVVAVNSGTAALHLSLLDLGLPPDAEVITTPLTFCATANAIIHAGARPVFADCSPDTMNIDPLEIRRRITPRTRAIVPVHYAGRPCDMSAISAIAAEHGLRIVEDCAHALESMLDDKHCGTIGDFGCFSFYATKAITTAEGGLVVCRDQQTAQRIRVRALHGVTRDAWSRRGESYVHYDVEEPGFKYNLTDLAASIGLHQLTRIETNWQRREALWQYYLRELSGLPVQLPTATAARTRHGLHLFTCLLATERKRDEVLRGLHELRIGCGVHYLPLHLHGYYRRTYQYRPGDFPHAEHIGARTLSLPLSPAMSDEDASDVVRAVRQLLE